MARASYIYLIFDNSDMANPPEALFTVKWEAFMWLDINGKKDKQYKVLRSRDGGKYEPVEVVEK